MERSSTLMRNLWRTLQRAGPRFISAFSMSTQADHARLKPVAARQNVRHITNAKPSPTAKDPRPRALSHPPPLCRA